MKVRFTDILLSIAIIIIIFMGINSNSEIENNTIKYDMLNKRVNSYRDSIKQLSIKDYLLADSTLSVTKDSLLDIRDTINKVLKKSNKNEDILREEIKNMINK